MIPHYRELVQLQMSAVAGTNSVALNVFLANAPTRGMGFASFAMSATRIVMSTIKRAHVLTIIAVMEMDLRYGTHLLMDPQHFAKATS